MFNSIPGLAVGVSPSTELVHGMNGLDVHVICSCTAVSVFGGGSYALPTTGQRRPANCVRVLICYKGFTRKTLVAAEFN